MQYDQRNELTYRKTHPTPLATWHCTVRSFSLITFCVQEEAYFLVTLKMAILHKETALIL
jgi:hypothetical protein